MLKLAGTEVPPSTLSVLRSAIAVTILSFLILFLSSAKRFRHLRDEMKVLKEWKIHFKLFFMGAFQNVLPTVLFTYILMDLDSAVAGVLISTQPLFVFVYTCIVKKDERKKVTGRTILGLSIGFLGVVSIFSVALEVIFYPNSTGHKHTAMLPYLEYLLAVAVWSISSVFWAVQNADKRIKPFTGAWGQNLYGCIISVPLMLGIDYRQTDFRFFLHITYRGWIGIVWMGVAAGVGSALCLMFLLSKIGPVKTSAVQYFVPVVSIIEAIIVFDSWADTTILYKLSQVVGAVLVVLGVLVMNTKKATKPPPEKKPLLGVVDSSERDLAKYATGETSFNRL